MTARHAFRDTTMPLTERETEVLRLIARGRTNIQIAEELGITFLTARNHVSSILAKLGVESRIDAADWWRAHGSVQPKENMRAWIESAVQQQDPTQSDSYGPGELQVPRIGCPMQQPLATCRDRFGIVATEIRPEGARLLWLHIVERDPPAASFQIVGSYILGALPDIVEFVLGSDPTLPPPNGQSTIFDYYELPEPVE